MFSHAPNYIPLSLPTDKIRKKYASLGDTVVSVRLERSPAAGLGLSLAGHRDRSRMAVFVCGLHPAGAAAAAAPPVLLGDEILEVGSRRFLRVIDSWYLCSVFLQSLEQRKTLLTDLESFGALDTFSIVTSSKSSYSMYTNTESQKPLVKGRRKEDITT